MESSAVSLKSIEEVGLPGLGEDMSLRMVRERRVIDDPRPLAQVTAGPYRTLAKNEIPEGLEISRAYSQGCGLGRGN